MKSFLEILLVSSDIRGDLMFVKGYTKALEEHIRKRAKFIADCKTCRFSNADGQCTNTNITTFDVVTDGIRTFCPFWLPPKGE